jgi:phosphopantothenoylcysteine decarboxylase/phosphopantothenate--cysteine ligase
MRVALGVTGCIAAYKAAEIVRQLRKERAEVDVLMTGNSAYFISPLTFQSLSGKRVILDQYQLHPDASMEHISLARKIDLLLIAPASANIINKFASGVADDFLSTFFLSASSPILIAPSMNASMYLNPVVQGSIEKLRMMGVIFIDPEEGELACGEEGIGRLASVDSIVRETIALAKRSQSLKGKKVVVTAGGTREAIDPVRYISNRSSGKMGHALAEAARRRGAEVFLISASGNLNSPWGVHCIPVESADEMAEAVLNNLKGAAYLFMAAAVSDYKPEHMSKNKLKKEKWDGALKMEKARDILAEVGKRKRKPILIGFAAETLDHLKNAKAKLHEKNLDWIAINDVGKKGIGFGSDRNEIILLHKRGRKRHIPEMYKRQVADRILDIVCKKVTRKKKT